MKFFPRWLDRFSKDVGLYNRSVNLSNKQKKMIKWKSQRGLNWYNNCEAIGLVYYNIDPYA